MYIGQNGEKINPDISIMNMICDSSELDLFNCDVVQDLINFKWQRFGKKWHMIGCFFNVFFIFILMIYINIVYIKNLIHFVPNPEHPEGGGTYD